MFQKVLLVFPLAICSFISFQLSGQLAVLTENHMRKVLKSSVKLLLKITEDTEANR